MVSGSDSDIKVKNKNIELSPGDMVKIWVDDGSQAHLYMTSDSISTCNLKDGTLFVNGVETGSGKISDVWISSYSSFDSTLDLVVPKMNKWTRLTVEGVDIINGDDEQVISLFDVQPGSDGVMNINLETSEIYFRGGIGSYQLS